MDHSADPAKLPTNTATGGHDFEHELSLSYAPHQTDSGGTISLQVLEFKTCLLEAVEELHIRRDAETRYEEQISKLVLEKQELEWQKESLQHQIDTLSNQHTESLANVKKQFQATVRGVEDEKGKHQLTAELKDKEMNSLKEELKLLQLFKYSLEKKLSELEQKLSLQSQSKDSHLNQLGEVEKRFGSLSRQCTMVKQAHENLEQNVDEAMRVNRKLTSVNKKQQTTISSLKQELGEVNNKLIKSKVSSVSRSEDAHSHSARELQIQLLQQKLLVETEMNKKLGDENAAERSGKLEVMSSLQHGQKLLLYQTQAISRVELELQTHREEHQALKREHEVMREKRGATEDRMARLTEEYANSKTLWEKEKVMLLEGVKNEQQDLKAVREAYDQLHQKYIELSSQAVQHVQHIHAPEKVMLLEGIKNEQQDLKAVREAYDQLHQKYIELSSQAVQHVQHIHAPESGLEALAKDSQSGDTGNRESSNENNTFESMDIPNEVSIAMVIDRDQTGRDDSNMESTDVKDQNGNIGVPMDIASIGSSQTGVRQIICNSIQSHSVPRSLCSVAENIGGQGPLGESIPIAELLRLGRLKDLAPSQTRDPDCLVVTESVDKLATTGATGGQDDNTDSKHQQPPQTLENLTPTTFSTTPLVADNHLNLPTISGPTGGQTDSLNTHRPNPNTSESDPSPASGLIDNAFVCYGGLLVGEGGSVSTAFAVSVSGPENRSVYRATDVVADLLAKEDGDGEKGGGKDRREGGKEGKKEGARDREGIERDDGKQYGEEKGRLATDATDSTERGEDGEALKEDMGETKKGETVEKDGTEEGWRDGAKGRSRGGEAGGGRVVLCRPETDTLAPTSADNKPRDRERSETLQGTDPVGNTQHPLAASQTSNLCLTLSQKVTKNQAETNHMKEREGLITNGDGLQNLNLGVQTLTDDGVQSLSFDSVQSFTHGVQPLNHDGVQALTHDVDIINSLPGAVRQVSENTMEESTPTLTADSSTLPSQPPTQSQRQSLQGHVALPASQSDSNVNTKEPEAADSHSKTTNPSNSDINMKEICDKLVNEEYAPVNTNVEPLVLPQSQLQESPTQENGLTKSVKADSGTCEKGHCQPKVNLCGKDACEITEQPLEKTSVKDTRPPYDSCVRITVENVGPLGCQDSPTHVDSALPDKGSNAGASTTNTLEMNGHQQHLTKTEKEDAEVSHRENILRTSDPPSHEEDVSPESSGSKHTEQPPTEEKVLGGDIDYSVLASNKKYRSSFEWASAQRKEVNSRTKPDASALHGFGQGSPVPELKLKRSAGFPGLSPFAIPTFLKGNQSSRDSLVISKASDLLSAPSASGLAASTKRDQRREWKAVRDTFRETATADMESNLVSVPPPVSTSSSAVSRLPWQTTPGSPSMDWFPGSSQEQSSIRAQINKIEQFLCAERLRLPKRPRTDSN